MNSFKGLAQAGGLVSPLVAGLEKLASNIYLRSIQRGLLFSLPLIFVGALSLCLLNFPVPQVQVFLDQTLGAGWRSVLESIVQGSFGVTSLAVISAIAFNIALLFNAERNEQFMSPSMNAMVALSCYIVLLGSSESWPDLFSLNHGLIFAVSTSVAVSFVFLRLASLRFLRISSTVIGHDPTTFQVLNLMPAATLTIVLFAGARVVFHTAFPEGIDVSQMLINSLFKGQSGGLGLGVLYTGVSQLLWFFGIHGPNMLFSLEQGTLNIAMLENIQAAAANTAPPHIMTKGFLDSFAYMGGSGATLSLILAMLYISRDKGNRRLCYLALLPALCNVNEPLLFGIPLVFNPLYIIPFLFAPLVNILTAYAATALDLVPRTITSAHWTTPALVNGYVATGSIAGTLLQVVNLTIGALVYLPFIKLSERIHFKRQRNAIKTLHDFACNALPGPNGQKCMSRSGFEGYLARSLADDLVYALKQSDQLFLAYQPQINTQTHLVEGVECLLRWRHPTYGSIPPPLTVALAEDSGVIDDLGAFVLKSACASFGRWKTGVCDDFLISVNLSARQLENPALTETILGILNDTGTPARHLEVEITESVAVTPIDATYTTLFGLRALGIQVAIDDFGMGHTSLRYIKEFPIDTVKLDKTLTEESKNGVNDYIVRSIMDLSQNLQLRTVVEGVETLEQCERFQRMGCSVFQGYYFSQPLSSEECFEYITSYKVSEAVVEEQDVPQGVEVESV
ncbi:MAG: EAL domain-containing protein [Desulfovibrio sp.]|nr:MAG: EAL domain-containing protein [Desulfovibrio sp.]